MVPSIVQSSRISLGNVTKDSLPQLAELHKCVFPVSYGEKFYNEVLHADELAKIIYFDQQCAGAICCRIEPSEYTRFTARVYMMTLGVLKNYRNLGLGSLLIEHIMQQAAKSTNPIVTSLYLHVQTVNEKAIRFYRRNGFRIQSIVPDYYKYIEHKDAYILTRPIFNTSHQLPLQPLPQIQIQPQQQQQQQQQHQ